MNIGSLICILILIHKLSRNYDLHVVGCKTTEYTEEVQADNSLVKKCENCRKWVDKTPQKFDLHTKRCNLYYKYIIETVFGFKCQFCPFEFTTKVKNKVDPR